MSFLPCRCQQGFSPRPGTFRSSETPGRAAFGQQCQEFPRSILGQALLLLHPTKPSPLEARHRRFAPISILWLIMPGQAPCSCGCRGSPGRAALPPQTTSSPRWGQHSRAASPATRSALAGSYQGRCLGHISHSSSVFQMLGNLAPASSLQDGLAIKPCRDRLTPPSPRCKPFPSCCAAGPTLLPSSPGAGAAAAPLGSAGWLRDREQCHCAVTTPGLPREL